MSLYDVFQQVFLLSTYSNAETRTHDTMEALQSAFERDLPPLLLAVGNWTVAWGPVAWKNDPKDNTTGPDNAWYVAKCPAVTFQDGSVAPVYVISIAATATKYDWEQEDLQVSTVVDFPRWIAGGFKNPPTVAKNVVNSGTYVSWGTASPANTILTFSAPKSAAGGTTSLIDFIISLGADPSTKGSKIILTGHSLGAALSPTVALALVRGGIISGNFTSEDILVYPIAGPSPGNLAFATLFSQTFKPIVVPGPGVPAYKAWNCNIVNLIDPVPQAWSIDPMKSPQLNLERIPTLYSPIDRKVVAKVAEKVAHLKSLAKSAHIAYFPLQNVAFSGVQSPMPIITYNQWLLRAITQHTVSYDNLLQVNALAPWFPHLQDSYENEMHEALPNFPVFRELASKPGNHNGCEDLEDAAES